MIPLLTIKNKKKSYGNNTLFSNLSFDLKPGEHIGLIGMNGSGKSTLLRLMMGLVQADAGRVQFEDQPIDSENVIAIRRQIGVKSESRFQIVERIRQS